VIGLNIFPSKDSIAILGLLAMLLGAVSCAKSLDMSDERALTPGPEWGVVIGSVLVRPQAASDKNAMNQDAASSSYEFEIVPIQPGDPNGEGPYVKKYRLVAKAGEERMFIARLRTGQYLMRSFKQDNVIGLGGELDVVFTAMAGEVRYLGRVVVDIPPKMTRGKDYRFAIENAREPTLARVSTTHPDLTSDVVNMPMEIRARGE
jgi:hypothetical protein